MHTHTHTYMHRFWESRHYYIPPNKPTYTQKPPTSEARPTYDTSDHAYTYGSPTGSAYTYGPNGQKSEYYANNNYNNNNNNDINRYNTGSDQYGEYYDSKSDRYERNTNSNGVYTPKEPYMHTNGGAGNVYAQSRGGYVGGDSGPMYDGAATSGYVNGFDQQKVKETLRRVVEQVCVCMRVCVCMCCY